MYVNPFYFGMAIGILITIVFFLVLAYIIGRRK
jgi:hypothetical protein